MVDCLLPQEVLSPSDSNLTPEHGLSRQLLVLQRLVDHDVVAALPRRGDQHGVLDELEGSPGELDSRCGVKTLKAAGNVDLGLPDLLLSELCGHGRRVDHHPGLGHGLALQGADLAGVGPGHGRGGFVKEEAAVLGVVVVAGREAQVHLVLEHRPDELRLGVGLAGNPLAEGRGILVEVPFYFQLLGLAGVVVEVAVEENVL